jgi:HEAT repeat protein
MRQARRTIWISFGCISLAAFAWFLLKPREPSYQGKPLSIWLLKALYSGADDSEACNAIQHIGTNAIPTLLDYASARDTRLMKSLLQMNEKESLIPRPFYSQDERHAMAQRGFAILGPDAKSAVPALVALMGNKDDSVRLSAIFCLGCIGAAAKDAVPDLIRELQREEVSTNNEYAAPYALGQIGPAARAAVPILSAALTNGPASYRAMKQAALIKMQAASISPFIEQLKDTSNLTQWEYSWRILFHCGTNADAAVPVLVSLLDNTNSSIQFRAFFLVGRLHQQPGLCVPALVRTLNSNNVTLKTMSINALGQFGKAAKPGVSDLVRCLDDPDKAVRILATNALIKIDPEAAAKAGIK